MLADNNVLYTESFAINLSISSALIYSCGVRIDVNAKQYLKLLRQRILTSGPILVLPQSEALVVF